MTIDFKRAIPFLTPLAFLAAAGCIDINLDRIEGSGVASTTTYEFDSFDEIDINSAFEADITIRSGPPSVEVTIDDNLEDRLEVEVDDGRLSIGFETGNYDFETNPTAVITVPDLRALEADGASTATLTGLDTQRFDLDVSGASEATVDGTIGDVLDIEGSGASNITVNGSAGTLRIDLSGASSGEFDDLSAPEATVELSGASSAELGAVPVVSGDLSGASSLVVDEDAQVSVETSGASDVGRR